MRVRPALSLPEIFLEISSDLFWIFMAPSRTLGIAGSLSGWLTKVPLAAAFWALSELLATRLGDIPSLSICLTDARKRSFSRLKTFRLVVSSNTPDIKLSGLAFSSNLLVR